MEDLTLGQTSPGTRPAIRSALEQLFVEVNGLANYLKKTAASLHREEGLPAGGQRLLQILSVQGAQTVPALARLSLTSRQNVQMAVNRLKIEGWIESNANPAHKRSVLVSLTPAGAGVMATALAREEGLWDQFLAQVSAAQVDSTTTFLRAIRKTLGVREAMRGQNGTGSQRALARKRAHKVQSRPREPQAHPISTGESVELPVSLL